MTDWALLTGGELLARVPYAVLDAYEAGWRNDGYTLDERLALMAAIDTCVEKLEAVKSRIEGDM